MPACSHWWAGALNTFFKVWREVMARRPTQILVSVLISSTTWVGISAALGAARCSRSLHLHAGASACQVQSVVARRVLREQQQWRGSKEQGCAATWLPSRRSGTGSCDWWPAALVSWARTCALEVQSTSASHACAMQAVLTTLYSHQGKAVGGPLSWAGGRAQGLREAGGRDLNVLCNHAKRVSVLAGMVEPTRHSTDQASQKTAAATGSSFSYRYLRSMRERPPPGVRGRTALRSDGSGNPACRQCSCACGVLGGILGLGSHRLLLCALHGGSMHKEDPQAVGREREDDPTTGSSPEGNGGVPVS